MTQWDWTNYLVGGGQRPDAVSGMADPFEASLASLFAAAPPEVQSQLRITSGYRSPERQSELWEEALIKYGSPEAARKWVAPPGKSKHNEGIAADMKYLSPAAQEWVHANAAQYGLHFPLSNEPWHVEPIGSRNGSPSQYAGFPAAQPQYNALSPKGYAPQDAVAQEPQYRYNALMLEPYRMT